MSLVHNNDEHQMKILLLLIISIFVASCDIALYEPQDLIPYNEKTVPKKGIVFKKTLQYSGDTCIYVLAFDQIGASEKDYVHIVLPTTFAEVGDRLILDMDAKCIHFVSPDKVESYLTPFEEDGQEQVHQK